MNNNVPNCRSSMYFYILLILQMMTMTQYVVMTMPMADVNKWMKIYNGNRNMILAYQNVPGNLSNERIHLQIDDVIVDLQPDVLGIAEPKYEEISNARWPGYNIIKGTIAGYEKVRVNALIKAGLQYTVEDWNLDIPTVVIKFKTMILIYTYREWAQGADSMTRDMPSQERRWKQFLDKITSIRGTKKDIIIIGDMNYDFWVDNTEYQRTLDPI